MKFGTRYLSGNRTEFNFWAPDSKTVSLWLKNNNKSRKDSEDNDFWHKFPMKQKKDGWFQLITKHAGCGTVYKFELDNKMTVPDPASLYQPEDVHGASVLINLKEKKGKYTDKFEWKGRPWNEAIIYEIHTGTFTQEGTFKALEKKLDYLLSLGITAIELMPLSDFAGKRNWGYDGVLSFAPDSTYGTPYDLKNLVKTAHQKGLMVFLDIVYNHFGPEGNYLYVYAGSKLFNTDEKTPWGDALNFKNRNVRDYFIQNALFWLQEYEFDGLRFDAVHSIKDDSKKHILKEMACTIKQKITDRHVHLILENDNNEAKYLNKKLYTAQWNDDFHHAMHVILTGESFGYYQDYSEANSAHKPVYHLAKSLTEGFAYQGEKSAYRGGILRGENSKKLFSDCFVNFLQNHDQVGNRICSQRINSIISPQALKAAICINIMAPSIPLLFMGEEFGCEQPFYYFCDFEKSLSEAVKAGRLKEISGLKGVFDKKSFDEMPCLTSEKAFSVSKIDWNQLEQKKHNEIFNFYKELITARKKYIIPFIPELQGLQGDKKYTKVEIITDSVFCIEWKSKKRTLKLISNLGNNDFNYDMDFSGTLIAQSDENGFLKLINQKIIQKWGVFWFLNENNK